jgi:hypothetical protein
MGGATGSRDDHSSVASTMMRKKRPLLASDLVRELQSDEEFVRRQAEKGAAIARREKERLDAEAAILADLRSAGVDVRTVWDLVNAKEDDPRAVPVLLRHLDGDYPRNVLVGIARALATPHAKAAWSTLLSRFATTSALDEPELKDALACALAATAGDDQLSEVVGLIKNAIHGEARLFLLRLLARKDRPDLLDVLIWARDDVELKKEAKYLLRLCKHGERKTVRRSSVS